MVYKIFEWSYGSTVLRVVMLYTAPTGDWIVIWRVVNTQD